MIDNLRDQIDPAEIASLMSSAVGVLPSIADGASTERADRLAPPRRSQDAASKLSELEATLVDRLTDARPYQLPSFEDEPNGEKIASEEAAGDADVEVHMELGRARLAPGEESILRDGAVIPLDKLAGDPVDVLVGGRVIARGEVLVLNDKLCVRIAEIIGLPFAAEKHSSAFA